MHQQAFQEQDLQQMGGVHIGVGPVTRQDKTASVIENGQWYIASLHTLSIEILKNAWHHGEYSYFPQEAHVGEKEVDPLMKC